MNLNKIFSNFEDSFQRAKFVSYQTDAGSLVYHVAIQLIFLKLQIYPMFFYNMVSISIFSFILVRLKKVNNFVGVYILAFAEIIVHQVLAEYFLGSNTNFHFFILLIGLVPFFVFQNKIKPAILFATISLFTFIVLENCNFTCRYPISDYAIVIIKNINITLSVIMIFTMILVYTLLVIKAQGILTSQKNKLETELQMASLVQRNFLKIDTSVFSNCDVSYYCKPMVEITGDVYDFYGSENNLEGFGLFDVSGHGLSAGLVTLLVKNIISQEFHNKTTELWEILNQINDRVIEEKGEINTYLTGILARINHNTLEISIAGHPAPIIYHKNTDTCEYLVFDNHRSTAIGISGFPAFFYSEYVPFRKGDELFLYTDGLTDFKNPEGEAFGSERLLKLVQKICKKSIETQRSEITNVINQFASDEPQDDDITFIVIKR